MIKEILNDEGTKFLIDVKAYKDRVIVDKADYWLGAYANDEIVGVLGISEFKKVKRIRALYVKKEYRTKLFAYDLLSKYFNKPQIEHTVFATEMSCNLFKKFGFNEEYRNRYGIYFLRRKADD